MIASERNPARVPPPSRRQHTITPAQRRKNAFLSTTGCLADPVEDVHQNSQGLVDLSLLLRRRRAATPPPTITAPMASAAPLGPVVASPPWARQGDSGAI